MSGAMQVLAIAGRRILDIAAIRRALLVLYAPDEVGEPVGALGPLEPARIPVTPLSAPTFDVRLSDDGSGCAADGLPDQNAALAVALRAEIPSDAGRVIALDTAHAERFADLVPGMTLRQLEAAWRPLAEFDENGAR